MLLQELSIHGEVSALESNANQQQHLDALINTTALGMGPLKDQSPLPELTNLPTHCVVLDAVMGYELTPFLRLAKQRDLPIIPGKAMFAAQAWGQFEHWGLVKANTNSTSLNLFVDEALQI